MSTSHTAQSAVPRAVLLDTGEGHTAHGQRQYGAGGHIGRKAKKKSHRMPADSLIIPGEGVYMGSLSRDGKREDSNGTLIYTNGDVYTGNWQSDGRHGTGTMSYKSTGAIYDGSWVHDMRNGHGRMKYSNGDEYSGAWEEDTKQGNGRFVWVEQGAVYEGQFQGGMIHGQGKYAFADGCVYEGQYERGKRRGRGVLVTADGVRQPGLWRGLERHPMRKDELLRPPSFRPDLGIQLDVEKHAIQKMVLIEEKLEKLKLQAQSEEAGEEEWGQGEEWVSLTPQGF